MSAYKFEVNKVQAFTPVNESIAKQASEFLDNQGKNEMALTMRTLLKHYEKTSLNKKKVDHLSNIKFELRIHKQSLLIQDILATGALNSSALPNDGKISEVTCFHCDHFN